LNGHTVGGGECCDRLTVSEFDSPWKRYIYMYMIYMIHVCDRKCSLPEMDIGECIVQSFVDGRICLRNINFS